MTTRPPLAPLVRAACAIALASLALSCSKGDGAGGPGGAAFTPPPMPVETAVVAPAPVADTFSAVGSVEADEAVVVASEIDGRVEALPFTEGEFVAAGAVLARLDASQLRAEVARAEAVLEQRRTWLERTRALARQEIVAAQSLDDAVSNLGVAQADVAVARARLDKTTISAPFAGVVGSRLVSPGAFVRPGEPITEIAHVERVKVTFSAPERYLGELGIGREVTVTTPARPGSTYTGRVTLVDPLIDAATRSAHVVATVDNAAHELMPGMSADVTVVLAQRPTALTIPSEAIFAEGAQTLVFVVREDGSVARTPITVGTRLADAVEIVSGLSAGQRVVRSGHQKLFEGAKVMPVDDAETRGAQPATTAAATP